jgi:hypothetical protein
MLSFIRAKCQQGTTYAAQCRSGTPRYDGQATVKRLSASVPAPGGVWTPWRRKEPSPLSFA